MEPGLTMTGHNVTEGPFAAELLRGSATAFAADAASRLLSEHPDCAARFGSSAQSTWKAHLTQRVHELAVAIQVGEPQLFAAQLDWSRVAFEAHRAPEDDLRASLEALLATLEEELPSTASIAPRTLRDALSVFDREPPRVERLNASTEHGRLALEFVERVLSGRRRRAIEGLVEAVDEGRCTLEDAYEKVLLPVQTEVGAMWHLGEITISEEHSATDTTRSAMAVLAQRVPAPSDDAPCVIAAAVEGNTHDIAVRCAADFLEMAGIRSASLGADVPVEDLVKALKVFDSSALVLSVALTTHLNALARTVAAVRQAQNGKAVRIVVGGRIFDEAPGLPAKLGADAYAPSPRDVPALVQA